MTFSYSGNPGASTRDLIRFLIQDTDSTDAIFQNEELDYLVTTWTNGYAGAVAAADIAAVKFSRQADYNKKVGDLSLSESFGGRSADYRAIADRLRKLRAEQAPPTPYINSEAIVQTGNKDVEQYYSDFYTGQFDNPSTSDTVNPLASS
jgi:hypothetical protein